MSTEGQEIGFNSKDQEQSIVLMEQRDQQLLSLARPINRETGGVTEEAARKIEDRQREEFCDTVTEYLHAVEGLAPTELADRYVPAPPVIELYKRLMDNPRYNPFQRTLSIDATATDVDIWTSMKESYMSAALRTSIIARANVLANEASKGVRADEVVRYERLATAAQHAKPEAYRQLARQLEPRTQEPSEE